MDCINGRWQAPVSRMILTTPDSPHHTSQLFYHLGCPQGGWGLPLQHRRSSLRRLGVPQLCRDSISLSSSTQLERGGRYSGALQTHASHQATSKLPTCVIGDGRLAPGSCWHSKPRVSPSPPPMQPSWQQLLLWMSSEPISQELIKELMDLWMENPE